MAKQSAYTRDYCCKPILPRFCLACVKYTNDCKVNVYNGCIEPCISSSRKAACSNLITKYSCLIYLDCKNNKIWSFEPNNKMRLKSCLVERCQLCVIQMKFTLCTHTGRGESGKCAAILLGDEIDVELMLWLTLNVVDVT